ncbi:MAG: MFS transporter [archaeon]
MKKQLKILLLINSFFIFGASMFAPLYAIYIQKIEAAVYHIGGIWSFFILSTGILILIISRFENHKEFADYFLIIGFLFRAVGWFGYYYATTLWHLYAVQLFMALGESFGTPSYNLLYSNFLTKGEFASDWGVNSAISSFIMALASLAGGLIVYAYGFKILFGVMIGLSLISSFLALKFRKSFT